jgi:CRP-like cAMP-binding protein
MHEPSGNLEANWLLASLSDRTYARLTRHCDTVPIRVKDRLYRPNEPFEHAYFPQSGCLSMITEMNDGSCVEVGTVGWEGMSGTCLLHDAHELPTCCMVQVTGTAKRIAVSALQSELQASNELLGLLRRYANAWVNQVGRSGSCNAVHSVEERFARWLLMTHDRVPTNVIPLTQELLAIMLGVRRPSVTLAAGALQRAGVIDYTRGKILVLDRAALEAVSCECYRATLTNYESVGVRRLVHHTA